MQNTTLQVITVFMGFFAIMNPIGNVPIFLALSQDYSKKNQKKVALTGVVWAFTIVTIFTVGGHFFFKLFGITLPAFQIAGGLILFVIGYQMLNGKSNIMHHDPNMSEAELEQEAKMVGITPLALPILAGPGTISTAMNFVGIQGTYINIAIVVGIFLVMCVITYFTFISGKWLMTKLSPSFLKVMSRIMGLILAVIAIQMLIMGIGGAIETYNTMK